MALTTAQDPGGRVSDRETRERLLDVAARLFADRGFDDVTVRDICQRAHANVAAINYHFGGKSGLYDAVLRTAMQAMQGTTDEMKKAGKGLPAEEQLAAAIRVFLTRVAQARDNWIHRLMLRELAKPTKAFDLVMTEVLEPRRQYVQGVIATMMDLAPDDGRVGLCMMSVQSQLVTVLNSPLSDRTQTPRLTAEDAEALARHIACFSIAGVRAIAKG